MDFSLSAVNEKAEENRLPFSVKMKRKQTINVKFRQNSENGSQLATRVNFPSNLRNAISTNSAYSCQRQQHTTSYIIQSFIIIQ